MTEATAAYAINDAPCSAAAFYRAACDPARPIAIEACAGAGKTWVLVSRMVRALLAGAPAQSILAITFTKKAAGEMRLRLAKWLSAFALADLAQLQEELILRGMTAAEAAQAAPQLKALQGHLLAQPYAVQIRTFHSWFAGLLKAAPISVFEALGLPAQFDLLEDDAEAIETVWAPFYRTLAADSALLADYQALITHYQRSGVHSLLQQALARRLEFTLWQRKREKAASLLPLAQAYPAFAPYASLQDALAEGTRTHTMLAEVARRMVLDKGKTNQTQGAALLSALGGRSVEGVIGALLTKDAKTRALKPRARLIDDPLLHEATAHVLELHHAQLHQHALEVQARMERLTQVLIAEYQRCKRARGWVDMVDVEQAASVLLGTPSLAAWVQEGLDAQVRHVLIDEFQDTSPLQWHILSGWLAGYAGAGGGQTPPSVFIVGDPKQSIYRFRNAEPRVFLAAQDFIRQGLGGDVLTCDHTRRNARQVVTVLNHIMPHTGMAQFRPHTTAANTRGWVGSLLNQGAAGAQSTDSSDADATPVHTDTSAWRDSLSCARDRVEARLRDAEYAQAASWIAQQLQAGAKAGDFMVLARKRERLQALETVLRQLHIPAVVTAKNLLSEQPEVQDVLALVDALLSPQKNLALAQALRSPIFALEEGELLTLALTAREHAGSWWQALQALAHTGAAPWQHVHARCLQWQTALHSLPPYDALFTIYHTGDVLARFAQVSPAALRARMQGHLLALLESALNFQGGRLISAWQWLRALRHPRTQRQFTVPVTHAPDAVQLLTIHGAKGLEAPHVLILDADPPAQSESGLRVFCDWPVDAAAPERVVFAGRSAEWPPAMREWAAAERALNATEEANALYVAMTRAKHSLLLSATPSTRRSSTVSWWQLWQAHVPPDAYVALQDLPPAKPLVADPGIIHLPHLPVLQAWQQEANTNPHAGQEPHLQETLRAAPSSHASRMGQALHRLLEWALPATQQPAPNAMQKLASDYALSTAEVSALVAQAQVMQQGSAAWVWQGAPRVQHAANEVALVADGRVLRLDRLLYDGVSQCWWVIDYKLATQPQQQRALQEQMQAYVAAVQRVYPADHVRGAWINGRGEWIAAD